jgi:hypothetical protein
MISLLKSRRKSPKCVVISRPLSPISWFNHLIGQSFTVLDVSPYNSVKICYDKQNDLYGWVPIECCEPHLRMVKLGDSR